MQQKLDQTTATHTHSVRDTIRGVWSGGWRFVWTCLAWALAVCLSVFQWVIHCETECTQKVQDISQVQDGRGGFCPREVSSWCMRHSGSKIYHFYFCQWDYFHAFGVETTAAQAHCLLSTAVFSLLTCLDSGSIVLLILVDRSKEIRQLHTNQNLSAI